MSERKHTAVDHGMSGALSDDATHLRYLLTAYIFGDISRAGREEVESHLALCAECRAERNRLSATLAAMCGVLGGSATDDSDYRFDERRANRVLASIGKLRGASRAWGWMAPAAVATLIVGLFVTLSQPAIFSGRAKSIRPTESQEHISGVNESAATSSFDPKSHADPATTLEDGRVLVTGGSDERLFTTLDTAEVFDQSVRDAKPLAQTGAVVREMLTDSRVTSDLTSLQPADVPAIKSRTFALETDLSQLETRDIKLRYRESKGSGGKPDPAESSEAKSVDSRIDKWSWGTATGNGLVNNGGPPASSIPPAATPAPVSPVEGSVIYDPMVARATKKTAKPISSARIAEIESITVHSSGATPEPAPPGAPAKEEDRSEQAKLPAQNGAITVGGGAAGAYGERLGKGRLLDSVGSDDVAKPKGRTQEPAGELPALKALNEKQAAGEVVSNRVDLHVPNDQLGVEAPSGGGTRKLEEYRRGAETAGKEVEAERNESLGRDSDSWNVNARAFYGVEPRKDVDASRGDETESNRQSDSRSSGVNGTADDRELKKAASAKKPVGDGVGRFSFPLSDKNKADNFQDLPKESEYAFKFGTNLTEQLVGGVPNPVVDSQLLSGEKPDAELGRLIEQRDSQNLLLRAIGEAYPDMLGEAKKQLPADERANSANYRTELVELTEEVDRQNLQIRAIEQKYPKVIEDVVRRRELPPIDGVVVSVRDNLVVLAVGKGTEVVQEGYPFIVYRGSQYVATVQVTHVTDDMAAASILYPEGARIQNGDLATTRLVEGSSPTSEPPRQAAPQTNAARKSAQTAERTADRTEQQLRAIRNYQRLEPTVSVEQCLGRPPVVPPPAIGDEGLGREAFKARYGCDPFVDTLIDFLSTFAMDVDTGSYTLARSLLHNNQLPDPSTVRTEEFINYFRRALEADPGTDFSVFCAGGPAPFAPDCEQLRVSVKARELDPGERSRTHLTFVVDTSGSMALEGRLERVVESLSKLLGALAPDDQVALVAYGSQAYLALPLTPARERARILGAIKSLSPRGETNIEAGLDLAYRIADESSNERVLSRVVLCSDGVATSGAREAEQLLAKVRVYAERGIYLTVVGIGMRRYNDNFLEQLANRGNGNYAFVDSAAEAERVFVQNLPATLEVLARDAKIQVEFNPEVVSHYRLLGYENRDIKDADFRNDAVDAGEVGPGSLVTAYYEIVRRPAALGSLGTVRVRYYSTAAERVEELAFPMQPGVLATSLEAADPDFLFGACVAEFAELLRDNYWARGGSYSQLLAVMRRLDDQSAPLAERQELEDLVRRAQQLTIIKMLEELKR